MAACFTCLGSHNDCEVAAFRDPLFTHKNNLRTVRACQNAQSAYGVCL